MIQVTLFGWLVVTLTSGLSVVLLLSSLTAVAYVSLCLLSAAGARGRARDTRVFGIASSIVAFGASMAGLRLSGPAGGFIDGLSLLGVSIGLAAAAGGTAALGWALLGRTVGNLLAGREQRRAALAEGEARRAEAAAAADQRRLEGTDLLADLAEAEVAVLRLRGGLASLVRIRSALGDKLGGLESDRAAQSLVDDCARARDDATTKIDLAERVLEEAESALFRLRCNQPVRRLVRRRPPSETIDLSDAIGDEEIARRLERAEQGVTAFVRELGADRAALDALESERPDALDADDDDDPLTHARAEVDAMASAYAAVLQRLQVVKMRLAAGSETRALARAAGVVSERTRGAAIDEAEVEALVREVARAEAGSRAVVEDDPSARSLVEALARSQAALDRSDAGSLREICGAMREIG